MATIYAVNVLNQTLADGDTINFGEVVRKSGNGYSLSAGNILVHGLTGLHDISTNVVFTSTSAGTATLQLYKDGVAIPGARSELAVLSGVVATLNIADAIAKVACACEEAVITAVLSGVGADISSASITVRSA